MPPPLRRGSPPPLGVGSAPSWSIQLSVFALGVCLVLATNPQARAIPWALVGCIVAAVVSWCNVVLSYALHYARLDLTEGGLEFPGTEERAFAAGGEWPGRVRSLRVEAHPYLDYPIQRCIEQLTGLGYRAWAAPELPQKWVYAVRDELLGDASSSQTRS